MLMVLSQFPTVTGVEATGSNKLTQALSVIANISESDWLTVGTALLALLLIILLPRTPLQPEVREQDGGQQERHHRGCDRRAFAQATWRHLVFGIVLAELERRLNDETEFEPLEGVPVSSNGHGNIEHAAVGATEA